MTNRVFVTGLGLITAIGNSVSETLTSLKASESGLPNLTPFETDIENSPPVCRIDLTNGELQKRLGINPAKEISRTALLGLVAAKEAVQATKLKGNDLESCGLISANSVGGMDRSENFYPEFLDNPKKGKLRQVIGHTCAFSTNLIADQLGLKSMVTTISTACSSSANAIMFGSRLIRHGKVDRVIAGGCDALTRFTVNGFGALKILDNERCKPFDEKRAGLNLGEGAGYLVLESETSAMSGNRKPICEVTGFANTCDAFHQTASSPEGEGSFLAMQQALNMAGLTPSNVDYINAHGTGTRNNDLSEGIAISRLFAPDHPPVSSTKPFTGHTLGAAGGIEAVLSCLSIRNNLVYPNLCRQHPMPELDFEPVRTLKSDRETHHVVSNSFGFGGNDSTLVFSRY